MVGIEEIRRTLKEKGILVLEAKEPEDERLRLMIRRRFYHHVELSFVEDLFLMSIHTPFPLAFEEVPLELVNDINATFDFLKCYRHQELRDTMVFSFYTFCAGANMMVDSIEKYEEALEEALKKVAQYKAEVESENAEKGG